MGNDKQLGNDNQRFHYEEDLIAQDIFEDVHVVFVESPRYEGIEELHENDAIEYDSRVNSVAGVPLTVVKTHVTGDIEYSRCQENQPCD